MQSRAVLTSLIIVLTLISCESVNVEAYLEEGYELSGADAAAVYERALTETDSEKIYYNLAYSYIEAGEYDKAIATATSALELYPEMLRFRYLRAYAYRETSRLVSYERELQAILEEDPGNNMIRGLLATYYKNMGLDSKAKSEAMEILRRDPADSTALSVMAGYSEFYDTIDSEETTKEDLMKKRPWSVPPELYDPLRIYRGEGLISWT